MFGSLKYIIIFKIFFLSVLFSQKEYHLETLSKKNDIYFDNVSNEIVNGNVYQIYKNIKVHIGEINNGKKSGKWTLRYKNGQKREEDTFLNGIQEGLSIKWYLNGKKRVEGTFIKGRPNGLYTEWYKNGEKTVEGTFEKGEENGLSVRWYENGKKKQEGSFKKGSQDGLWYWWYPNGENKKIGEFKNGKFILKKKWPKISSISK